MGIELGELRFRSGQRVTRDAAFPIGSITKTFTATLAMILVDDGDLELDAPLDEYLPDVSLADVTLRQLLSHTSGLPCDPDAEDLTCPTIARYVREHAVTCPPVLPPGAAFSYSNMGYVLVGRLIEIATGMSWREAMSSILLQPLGIQPAYIVGREGAAGGRPIASGHSVNRAAARTRPVGQSLAACEAPAGALAVSAMDLVALGRAHLDGTAGELLPARTAAQMRTPVPAADPFGLAEGWGLGLAVFQGSDGDWVGHDGNADGTACYLRLDPRTGSVIALTSNANTGLSLWRDLLGELAQAGLGIEPASTWKADTRPVPPPAGAAGTFVNGGVEYRVLDRKDGLYLVADDAPPSRITCYEGLAFSVADPISGQVLFGGRFLRDGFAGRIDAVQLSGRLARRRGPARQRGRGERSA